MISNTALHITFLSYNINYPTPSFPSIMSRDQEEMSDKNFPDYEKLFKKRKLLDLLVPRLSEVYNPERNLAVDETLVKFKGKIYFPHFFPITPARALASNVSLLLSQVVGMSLSVKFTLGRDKGCRGKILAEEWSWT